MAMQLGLTRPSPLIVRIASGAVILLTVIALVTAGLAGVYALAAIVGAVALWEFRLLSGQIGWLAPAWLIFPLGAFFTFSGTLLKGLSVELVLSASLVGGLGYLLLYTAHRGVAWLLFTILAVVVSDVAALVVGMRIGRRPFFNRISPRKTVEGAVAGVALAVPVMIVGGFGVLGLPVLHAIALGVLIGVSAELGDLVESQMKRVAGVKDSSNLIPGHGGVLDRIDSVLFPPIVVYFYALGFHLL
jgi:phosphatidate cytidylyltransferase